MWLDLKSSESSEQLQANRRGRRSDVPYALVQKVEGVDHLDPENVEVQDAEGGTGDVGAQGDGAEGQETWGQGRVDGECGAAVSDGGGDGPRLGGVRRSDGFRDAIGWSGD